ncbi:hypothetical protein [Fluviispira sanaruensis]|uniref:Uncharacterized protein n=1 Tax=Fluviispira sanaruensis TaxID=2493639 RepID=A0A4P2VNH3_FLUSA|nr:hypothetical protein [Fluviispira sanaruensis]BBH54661.1 hypothetical protein JCM31447_31350 [Fluviispira sanaruensis]
MGAVWKFSFYAYHIPKNRFPEISKIVSEILMPEAKFYMSPDRDFGQIEIANQEIFSDFTFDRSALSELKKRIWENGFLNFHFGAESVHGVGTVEYGESDYKKFRTEKNSNLINYVSDYQRFLTSEDDLARAYDISGL